ncbi:hypothetical protein ABKN59_001831 [Abortiporus biennis]
MVRTGNKVTDSYCDRGISSENPKSLGTSTALKSASMSLNSDMGAYKGHHRLARFHRRQDSVPSHIFLFIEMDSKPFE